MSATATKKKRRRTPLAAEAKSLAHEQRDKLADCAVDVFHARFPSWSLDTLLSHPRCAIHVCHEVARRLNRRSTEDFEHEVCRSLLNSRKHGDLRRDPV